MEPGHEDREYGNMRDALRGNTGPQWSPVMKTGNTSGSCAGGVDNLGASMEPGHEDREYATPAAPRCSWTSSLNGARS